MADFPVRDGQKWIFIGDSITDCGRRAENAPLGNGYARSFVDLVTARYPRRNIAFVNKGIGGNTVEDLRNRWHDDVLALRPDWLSIMVGINDLHRNLTNPGILPPDRFEVLCHECLSLAKEKTTARVILISPFYISTDTATASGRSRVLECIPDYVARVQGLAEEFGAAYVPLHAVFQEHLTHRPADTFCPEPVHPNASGHLVIAHELLKAVNW